jgi:hypothetical protein
VADIQEVILFRQTILTHGRKQEVNRRSSA